MNLDTRFYQEFERQIGEILEQHAAEIISGRAVDWPDLRYRVGLVKGLRDALKIAKEVNEDIIGIKREER
jgi:hypothetical protein